MINANSLSFYSSESLDTSEDDELRQRLGLYQVFLKLYDHHRGLLDEILSLENSSNRSLTAIALPYIQALVFQQQTYLLTNLINGVTQTFTQPQNIWTIGRDSRKVVLPIPDKRLSRCHAAIRYVDQRFELVDLGSSNGSYINGELVKQPTMLNDGDRIRLGSMTFAFLTGNTVRNLSPLSTEIITQLDASKRLTPNHPLTALNDMSQEDKAPSNRADEEVILPISPEETLLFMKSTAGVDYPLS